MQQRDNLLSLVESVFRRKKQILWLCAIAGIGAIIISLFLPNYYQSTSIFYAASSDITRPDPIGPDLKERSLFGIEDDIDKIMTCASSTELVDFLITKFDLYTHYDIDPAGKRSKFKIREAVQGAMELKKTKYEAIELSIEDKEPEMAANMVNAATDKINTIAQNLTKSAQAKQIENRQASMLDKERSMNMLGDTLQALSQRYEIYNVLAQSESIAESLTGVSSKLAMNQAKLAALKNSKIARRDSVLYLTAQQQGLVEQKAYLEQKIIQFNQGSSKVSAVNMAMKTAQEQYASDQERLKQLQAAYASDSPMILPLERGEVPIVKSRPKRSFMVIGAVLITFIFMVIYAILMDAYKDVNWKEIINAK